MFKVSIPCRKHDIASKWRSASRFSGRRPYKYSKGVCCAANDEATIWRLNHDIKADEFWSVYQLQPQLLSPFLFESCGYWTRRWSGTYSATLLCVKFQIPKPYAKERGIMCVGLVQCLLVRIEVEEDYMDGPERFMIWYEYVGFPWRNVQAISIFIRSLFEPDDFGLCRSDVEEAVVEVKWAGHTSCPSICKMGNSDDTTEPSVLYNSKRFML